MDALNPHDEADVRRWWSSLPTHDRHLVQELYSSNDNSLPTFSFELVDEFDSSVHDDGGDRYEYLVNHEHKVKGGFLGDRSKILPAIALMSPDWPPYSKESRFEVWEFTESLTEQLQAEFQRQCPGNGRSDDRRSLSWLWHAERQYDQEQEHRLAKAVDRL